MPPPGETPSRQPSILNELLYSFAALGLPSGCALCSRELTGSLWGSICADCWRSLTPWAGPVCRRCGLPLSGLVDRQNALCVACRRDEPHFDVARSYGVYSRNLRGAVLALKFHERQRLGLRLGGLLLES